MTRLALPAAASLLALQGCALLATPTGAGLAGAALGATAAALDFDTEVLKVWNERNPPAEEKKP